jgi:hypothetical protein
MKYRITQYSEDLFVLQIFIGGQWFSAYNSYSTRRAAIRAAKRAGGTEEVK